MTYNAARSAGILGGEMSPELKEFYASLTQAEAETLISVKSRLETILPDVVAHSYTAPGAFGGVDTGLDMKCARGAWSWSGSGAVIE